MNILHVKYAVEVARLGSLSKASESLIIAQPNISRSIKELEADLGISIFNRSVKGMMLTPEGEEFIGYAQEILKQIDEVEKRYKRDGGRKRRFSVSVPRSAYIAEAFAAFTNSFVGERSEILYKETDSIRTVNGVINGDYKLGIIRYAEPYDKNVKSMLEEKHLAYEVIASFSYSVVTSHESTLAKFAEIGHNELEKYTEIVTEEPYLPSNALERVFFEEDDDLSLGKIVSIERANQLELLGANPNTYIWAAPLSEKYANDRGLAQVKCRDLIKKYKDVLIYNEGYRLSETDKRFITDLCAKKREFIG